MLMSKSMDADVIRISQSWSEFLVLLVVQHSHVVSEHVIDQVSVVRINGLINIVLVVSSIHGIPAEVVFVEIIRFNEHIVERANVDVWADVASLSVEDLLDIGQDLLDANVAVIESEESAHDRINVIRASYVSGGGEFASLSQLIALVIRFSIVIWHE